MKRMSWLLAVCLLAAAAVPAAAAGGDFHYASEGLGFSLTVPGLAGDVIETEEYDNGVRLYHGPSKEQGGGLLGAIEVVSPRSAFFSAPYTGQAYRVLAMGEDRIYLWKSCGGGVDATPELMDAFVQTGAALAVERLRECLVPAHPDALPVLNTARRLAYLPAEGPLVRPDAPLTRGELAEMLYALLDADNKAQVRESPFSDTSGRSCARAAGYLGSYGILSGYPDGTFRPDAPVSRAQFAVLLHRVQFAAPAGRYGDAAEGFSDVPAGHWAAEYMDSAAVLGWMNGYADGGFHPDGEITRAGAVTAINRMLGRDESHTAVAEGRNLFLDLDAGHWAYENLLEAAGALPETPAGVFLPEEDALPAGTAAFHFVSGPEGWAVSGSRLRHTADGGRTWAAVGQPLTRPVSGLFFFDSQNGLLLAGGGDAPWALLRTADGGTSWTDFLADPAAQARHLPAEPRLPDGILSMELRPARGDAVYLTLRYRPYVVSYPLDLTGVRQTVITAEELSPAP